MRVPFLLVVVALLVPGCAVTTPDVPDGTAGATLPPAPRVDARETLDLLKAFSEAYPYRQSGQETHLAARDFLEKTMADAGLEVVRQAFDSRAFVAPVPYQGENVIGIRWGEDRERWVVVGAHYDVTEGAVYGTYDDGSGTAMTLKLAEAFARVPTNRTIAFVLFDQEERGLVGSNFFIQSVVEGSFQYPVTLEAMVDLDMIGITWPHPAKLVCWQNDANLKARTEEARKAVGVPDENMEYREPSLGTSDGAAFIAAGVPTVYFWSNWDDVVTADGQRAPVPYPWWHQADTYETMRAMAGDEATLEAGFQTVLDIVGPVLQYAASPAFQPPAA